MEVNKANSVFNTCGKWVSIRTYMKVKPQTNEPTTLKTYFDYFSCQTDAICRTCHFSIFLCHKDTVERLSVAGPVYPQ